MNKFDYKTAFLLGLGFFGISAVWAAYNSFVPVILKNLALSNAVIGLFMTMDNLLAVTIQPAIGSLSDRTKTRIGKRMPYIIIGLPAAAICFSLIPFIINIYLLAGVLFLLNLSMALYRTPIIALMPDRFEPSERGKANGIINLMGGAGALIAFFVAGRIFDIKYQSAFIFIAVVLLGAGIILIFSVKEKTQDVYEEKTSERSEGMIRSSLTALLAGGVAFSLIYFIKWFEPVIAVIFKNKLEGALIAGIIVFAIIFFKSIAGELDSYTLKLFISIFLWFFAYNAIETFFTLFCKEEIGLSPGKASKLLGIFSLSFILSAIPVGSLSVKINKRKMISIGLISLILISGLISGTHNVFLIGLLLFIGGTAWAMININAYPLVCNASTNISLGKITGYYYFFSMLAQILSPPANGILIDITGSYKMIFIIAMIFFAAALLMVKKLADPEMK